MKLKPTLTNSLLLSIFILSSCLAVKTTNKTKEEEMVLKPVEQKDVLAFNGLQGQNVASRGGMDDIIGKGISLAAEGVKKLIAIDRDKYAVEYTRSIRDMFFYKQPSTAGPMDPNNIKFDGFSLTRTVQDKTGKVDTAMFLSVAIDTKNPYEIINNSLFRLKMEDFELKYARCKIPDRSWYIPWTWFYKREEKMTLNIEITIKSSWMTQAGVFYDQVPIGSFLFTINELPLDGTQAKFIEEKVKGEKFSGYSILVPRSYGNYYSRGGTMEECWGEGMYSLSVKVTEASGEKLVETLILDNSETIVDQVVKRVNK